MKHSKKVTKTETVIVSSLCSIIAILTCINGATRTRVTTVEQKQEVATVQEEYSICEYDLPLLLSSLPKSSIEKFSPIMFDLEGDYVSIEELKLNKELKTIAGIKISKNPLIFHFLEDETGIIKSIEKSKDASEESENETEEETETTEESEEVEKTETDEEASEEVEKTETDVEESEKVEETETDEKDSEEVEETDSDEEESEEVEETKSDEDSEHEVETDNDSKYAEESKVEVANVEKDEEVTEEVVIESSSEDPQGEFKDKYSREVQLLAGIMYLEEGIYVNKENGEYIHKLAGSVVLHRVESDIYPDSVEEVLYDPGQYGSRTRRLIETVEIPEVVYVWAQEIYDNGPLGPSNLVFQAGIVQGEIYYQYENQYFCLSKRVS